MLGYALLVTIMTMSNEVTPPVLPAARTSAVVAAVWLVLGVLWMGWIAALGALIHEALAGVWFVSDIALAIAVGWWMVRVRRDRKSVV